MYIFQVEPAFRRRLESFEADRDRAIDFVQSLNDFSGWVSALRASLDEFNSAVLYTPMRIDPNVSVLGSKVLYRPGLG